MKLEFSRQIFEKVSNIKFHQNPSSGSRVVPCGRTDMTKLIVAFRNFANVPKNVTALHYSARDRKFSYNYERPAEYFSKTLPQPVTVVHRSVFQMMPSVVTGGTYNSSS